MAKRYLQPGQKIENYSTLALIRDTLRYVRPYKWRFISGTVLRLSGDVIVLYSYIALAQLINIFATGNVRSQIDRIWRIITLYAIAVIANHLLRYFAKLIIQQLAEQVFNDAERQAIEHLFKLDIAWHEKENTGNKLKRIQTAANGFSKLLNIWVNNLIEICVNFVGVVIIVAHFDHTVTLLIIGFLIIYFAISKILLKKVAVANYNYNVSTEELTGLEYESINNIRSVKVMSMIDSITFKLRERFDTVMERSRSRVWWGQNRNIATNIFGHFSRVTAMVIIIQKIINGQLQLGFLVLFNSYFGKIWESIDELSNVSEDILVARYSISRLNLILAEPITIENEKGKKKYPEKWQEIEFKNVSFAYGDNEVLKDLSLTIHRGEKIGIMGLSGAGKSTLFKLLLKEYESFSGEILIDGVPIQKISKRDYFRHTAVVLQDTEVFNMSLKENIFLSSSENKPSESLLKKALTIAHVNDFLPKLPNGIDTEIGEKGVRLSGGERQRLGLARAVYKNPEILLLDEATSHLDLESEEKIQDSLHKFFNSVTAVVIAHRLTTIKEMDKILVIEDGQIIESGNFAELTAKRGRFYELWEKQRL